MESNLNIKTSNIPKFNVKTVSSAVFGKEEGGSNIKGSFGESIRNIHKKLSELSGHVRKALVRIKALEGKFSEVEPKLVTNIEKTTEIEKKSVVNKDNIGGNQDNLSKSLIETNKILVGIQQQLALQSSNEQKEQKTEIQQEKREKSKKRLKAEESALEKTAKGIGKAVGKVTSKILSPIKGLFDQVLDFILTLGAGVAVNAAFEWLSKEENRKKIENAFEYVKEHWKWIAGVAAGIVLFGPAVSLISAIVSLAGALLTVGGFVASVLGAPAFLTLLGVITAAGGIIALSEFIKNRSAGGSGFRAAIEANNQTLMDAGVGMKSSPLSKEAPLFRENPEGGYFNMVKQGVDQRTGQYGNLTTGSINPKTGQTYATEQQISAFESWKKRNKILTQEKDAMYAEIDKARDTIITERELFTRRPTSESQVDEFNEEKQKIKLKYQQRYIEKYGDPTFGGMFNPYENLNPEARAMGGPVTSGKPYLVGERGPEIFAPNVDGSVINNMRTEKIYQMISSKRRGRGGIDMITLPPITNQMPPPEIPVPQGPATEVPDISSVNMADPYRQITPMLYGITV